MLQSFYILCLGIDAGGESAGIFLKFVVSDLLSGRTWLVSPISLFRLAGGCRLFMVVSWSLINSLTSFGLRYDISVRSLAMLPAKQKLAASRVVILKRLFIIWNFDVFNVVQVLTIRQSAIPASYL